MGVIAKTDHQRRAAYLWTHDLAQPHVYRYRNPTGETKAENSSHVDLNTGHTEIIFVAK